MSDSDLRRRIEELERAHRIMKARLLRSERRRLQLEQLKGQQEALIQQVFAEMEKAHHTTWRLNEELDRRVQLRTKELSSANQELLQTRDEAIQDSRAKSTFLANMSHELRTPLTAILGYAELLCEDVEGDAPVAEIVPQLKGILRAGTHLRRLIGNILDLSKIEVGRMGLYIEWTDLDTLLADLMLVSSPLAQAQHNALRHRPHTPLGGLYTDKTKLRQALLNLVGNAAKFTENGEILLQSSRDQAGITLSVEDTGVGIPADQLATLFDPYVQVEGPKHSSLQGTGLGLAITRHYCRLLGGDVVAQSQLGRGSQFVIQIPLIPPCVPAMEGVSDWAPVDAQAVDATILVVDSDPQALQVLAPLLRSRGFEVHCATSWSEALGRARDDRPDLLLFDVVTAAPSGLDGVKQLRGMEGLGSVPLVVLSSARDHGRAKAAGIQTYLTKPTKPEELMTALTALLTEAPRG